MGKAKDKQAKDRTPIKLRPLLPRPEPFRGPLKRIPEMDNRPSCSFPPVQGRAIQNGLNYASFSPVQAPTIHAGLNHNVSPVQAQTAYQGPNRHVSPVQARPIPDGLYHHDSPMQASTTLNRVNHDGSPVQARAIRYRPNHHYEYRTASQNPAPRLNHDRLNHHYGLPTPFLNLSPQSLDERTLPPLQDSSDRQGYDPLPAQFGAGFLARGVWNPRAGESLKSSESRFGGNFKLGGDMNEWIRRSHTATLEWNPVCPCVDGHKNENGTRHNNNTANLDHGSNGKPDLQETELHKSKEQLFRPRLALA